MTVTADHYRKWRRRQMRHLALLPPERRAEPVWCARIRGWRALHSSQRFRLQTLTRSCARQPPTSVSPPSSPSPPLWLAVTAWTSPPDASLLGGVLSCSGCPTRIAVVPTRLSGSMTRPLALSAKRSSRSGSGCRRPCRFPSCDRLPCPQCCPSLNYPSSCHVSARYNAH